MATTTASIEEQLFRETVHGRVPLTHNISAVGTWTLKEGLGANVPRPDKSIGWLRLLTFVGLDHMYLRSPITGMAKIAGLTVLLGILLGAPGAFKGLASLAAPAALWYFWDIAQIWLESDRVVNYGMSLPFDMGQRIGQGVVNPGFPRDVASHYEQRKEFTFFALRTLLGFLGVDALMGKPALFVRKLTEFIIFVGLISGIVGILSHPFGSGFTMFAKIFGLMVQLMFFAVYAVFVLVPWWSAVSTTVLNPERMMTQGIHYDPETLNFLNYFDSWTEFYGPETVAGVKYDYGYENTDPAELRKNFQVEYRNDEAREEDKKGKPGKPAPAGPSTTSYLYSFLLGNPVTGPILTIIATCLTPGLKAAVRGGVTLQMATAACVRREHAIGADTTKCVAEGGVAALKAAASGVTQFLPPGATALLDKGTEALATAQSVMGQVQGARNAAKSVMGQVQGARNAITSQVQGAENAAKSVMDQVHGAGNAAKSVMDQVHGARNAITSQVTAAAGNAAKSVMDQVHGASSDAAATAATAVAATHSGQHALKGITNFVKTNPLLHSGLGDPVKHTVVSSGQSVHVGGGGGVGGGVGGVGVGGFGGPLSTESKVLGVVTMALIVGGAVKTTVDSLMRE